MSKKTLRLAAAGIGATFLLGACGSQGADVGSGDNPKERLSKAASNLTDDRYATWDISVQGTAQDVSKLTGPTGSFTEQDAQKLLGSSMTIKADTGKDKESTSDDVTGISLKFDGTDMGELITQGSNTAYLKINVEDVKAKYPEFQTQVDQFNQGAEQSPQYASFKPLLAGEWVKVNTGPDSPVGKYLAQTGGGTQTPDPAQAKALKDRLEQAMRDVLTDAKVTEASDDDNHLIATINGRAAYAKLRPVLLEAVKSTGGMQGQQLESQLPAPEAAPDKPFTIDLWVEDDTFKRMDLNLAQFTQATTSGPVSIRIDMDDKADVKAPSDAKELDLQPLLDMYNQQMSAALS